MRLKGLTVAAIAAVVSVPAVPARAQEVQLPTYTPEQRWERLAFLDLGWQAAIVALGREKGMTAEEVGHWVGEFFAPGWLGGAEGVQLLRGFYRNFMSVPGATVEVVGSTPTSVTARFNRPIDALLAPGGSTMGVTRAEIDAMYDAIDAAIADWVGVGIERRADGDHDVLTFTTEYGPIRAGDEIRWSRGSYLSWITSLRLLSVQMASGLSAREVGEADAKLYGPGWTARTPWQLYRGMVWNWMTDPDTRCEVLSASPSEVRARCAVTFRQVVEQNREYFNVTVQDVLESNRAFAAGVADHLGMQWTETLDGDYRVITVTKK